MQDSGEFKSIPIDKVYIGMYIRLNMGWMDHPFATNSFKIKNEAQLKTLKSLGLESIQYDPARSDRPPVQSSKIAEVATQETATLPTLTEEELQQQAAQKEAKRIRLEFLSKQRTALAECERKFVKAAESIKSINQNLYSKPAESVAAAGALVDQMLEAFTADKDVALILVSDSSASQEMYFHSLNVAVLSMILGREMACSKEEIGFLGMGAIFHDIGKTKIPGTILLKTEPLTSAENKFLRQHTLYGAEIAHELKLPPVVIEIVRHHHENVDGTGYPDGLDGIQFGKLSKILAVANTFDNLCNKITPTESLPPYDALAYMFAKQRNHFDAVAISTFIRSMGVYPPGTVVRLSNEMLGLVVSVNSQKPLKPKVLLYDSSVPKEEAIILDLEQDADINITKSLRPAQLSHAELAYLNPRKRVTYYFDEATSSGASIKT